jgi:hypothetical protein
MLFEIEFATNINRGAVAGGIEVGLVYEPHATSSMGTIRIRTECAIFLADMPVLLVGFKGTMPVSLLGFSLGIAFELIGFGRSEFASGEEVNFVSIFCHRILNAKVRPPIPLFVNFVT